MSTLIKENYKKILIIITAILVLPFISILIDIISVYGNYVGTQARILVEEGTSR